MCESQTDICSVCTPKPHDKVGREAEACMRCVLVQRRTLANFTDPVWVAMRFAIPLFFCLVIMRCAARSLLQGRSAGRSTR